MRNIFSIKIPLVITVLICIILTTFFVLIFFFINRTVNYSFALPEDSSNTSSFIFGPDPSFMNPVFFESTRNALIKNQADFIDANLSTMIIKVYIDGEIEYEAPILAKGRKGSWWETPAGIYKIEAKMKNHFSSFGRVYLPWSMPFHGNFFIHGWPYHPGGTPVRTAFSGGCIRLSNESARKVFNLTTVGMPLIVFEEDFIADNFSYNITAPDLSAKSFLVADLHNNYILLERNRNETLPIASITKTVTALVAAGYLNFDSFINIQASHLVRTSMSRLKVGNLVSVYNLLFPLLLESSNEAAEAIASRAGRGRFITLMNAKADSINLYNTEFVDPSGIGEGNKSTASDLFSLAQYLYNNRSFILKMSAGEITDSAYGEPVFQNLRNFNFFGDDPSFIGGKSGQTIAARETFLGVWNIEIRGTNRKIAIIILGSEDSRADIEKILTWIKANYQ